MNYNISLTELQKIIAKFQYLKDGRLNYTDFILATIDKKLLFDEEHLRFAFKQLDRNNQGFITRDNIERALEIAGTPIGKNQPNQFLSFGEYIDYQTFK